MSRPAGRFHRVTSRPLRSRQNAPPSPVVRVERKTKRAAVALVAALRRHGLALAPGADVDELLRRMTPRGCAPGEAVAADLRRAAVAFLDARASLRAEVEAAGGTWLGTEGMP